MTSSSQALPAPARHDSIVARARRFARTERGIATIALGAVALHIADDNLLQPEPGTSPTDHLASGLIPIAVITAAAAAYLRARAGIRAALALTFGVLGIAFGIPSAYWLSQGEASGDHYTTGPLTIAAGVVLIVDRPCRPLALPALLRLPPAHRAATRADHRRIRAARIRRLRTRRLPRRLRVHLHAHWARRRRARPPRPVRAGHRHDERLARAHRLVRTLEEPRRGDPLPRRDPLRRSPDADPPRLRRPAPEPARPGHERGRHRPLGGRPRPDRGRRVPEDAPGRGRRPDRRLRLLRRRRDPDRGRSTVVRLQGDRLRGRRLPGRRGRPDRREPRVRADAGPRSAQRLPSSPTSRRRRRSSTGSARSLPDPCS